MKYIFSAIKASTILLCLLVFNPCFAKTIPSAFSGDVHKGIIFLDSNISEIMREITLFNNPEVISDFIPHNIGNEIKLLSRISAKGKPVSNVSAKEKTGAAPECRKYKCRQGLSDQEWEKGLHIFILCFFVIPFLSTLAGVVAGVKGWIRFN